MRRLVVSMRLFCLWVVCAHASWYDILHLRKGQEYTHRLLDTIKTHKQAAIVFRTINPVPTHVCDQLKEWANNDYDIIVYADNTLSATQDSCDHGRIKQVNLSMLVQRWPLLHEFLFNDTFNENNMKSDCCKRPPMWQLPSVTDAYFMWSHNYSRVWFLEDDIAYIGAGTLLERIQAMDARHEKDVPILVPFHSDACPNAWHKIRQTKAFVRLDTTSWACNSHALRRLTKRSSRHLTWAFEQGMFAWAETMYMPIFQTAHQKMVWWDVPTFDIGRKYTFSEANKSLEHMKSSWALYQTHL